MFLKEFEIRWSDVDANRHLANSAYTNFMSHTRLAFLLELGFDQKAMQQMQIGPVVFYEHMYYFKEVLPETPLKVSLEFIGLSEDGMFFEFYHNFYDNHGKNMAHCEMMGAWINLTTRRLTGLSPELLQMWSKAEKAEGFRILTKADTRKYAKVPKDLANID